MNKYDILNSLNSIVKDSVIELHPSENYSNFVDEDDSVFKDDKGELIWKHYGEDFEVKNLDKDEFSLLFGLLLSSKAITYNEYTHLVYCLLQ